MADLATPRSGTLSRSPAQQPRSPELLEPLEQLLGLGLSPRFPRGTSATSIQVTPAGQSHSSALHALRGTWAQVHPVAARPFLASCSGSVLGSRPHCFFHSVLFCAFSPRSPCSRLGKVQEMLPSVVTPEPFGLNSKCERQRPRGAGAALHV